jgi:hypothetical protein
MSTYTQCGIDDLTCMESLNVETVECLTDRNRKNFSNKVMLGELRIANAHAIDQLIVSPSLWELLWAMQEITCYPEAVLVIEISPCFGRS